MDKKFFKINNYYALNNTMYLNKSAISHYHRDDNKDDKCIKLHMRSGLFGSFNNLPTVYTICEKDNKELFDQLDKK